MKIKNKRNEVEKREGEWSGVKERGYGQCCRRFGGTNCLNLQEEEED
jgi:hypothetical protein